MWEFFVSDVNNWYSFALGIVIVLGLAEGLGLLFGLSLSALIDNVSPIELDYEMDLDADVSQGGLTQILGWLCLNRLPLMIWLVIFLVSFSITGYVINYTSINLFQWILPSAIALPVVACMALFIASIAGRKVAKLLPKNESSAISQDSFAGNIAYITTGTARVGSPAEASFTDQFKQKHYLMVEPIDSTQEFAQGHKVVLVQKGPRCWQVTSFQ